VFGGFAVRQFVASPAAWEVSAADSRAGNEECMTGWFPFHPFYDSHDVWHFLSAAALFLSFMVSPFFDSSTETKSIPFYGKLSLNAFFMNELHRRYSSWMMTC